MAFDPAKAALYNQLVRQGLSSAAAAAQAGIGDDDGNYEIDEIGTPATNPNFGTIQRGGADMARRQLPQPPKPTAEELAEDAATEAELNPPPGSRNITSSSYTTTSTETVSGGGSTTITAGPKVSTAGSEALQPVINAKQAEIDAFNKDNPSPFARKKQGLPPLTQEENQARIAKQSELNDQRTALVNGQTELKADTPPTVTTVPNTATTTQTVTTGTSSTNQAVNPINDEQLTQQTETYLESTTTIANSNSASQTPLNPASDPSQFPAYDDDGNLEPGFAINDETGETFYRGFGTTTNQAVTSPTDYGSAYADAGVFDQLPVGQVANLNDPYYGLSPQQLETLGGADPTDPYIRARLGIPQLPSSTLLATPAIGTINTGVPLVDNALNFITGLFGGKPTSPAVTQTGTTTGSTVAAPDTAPVAQAAEQIIVQDTNLSQDKQVNLINIDSAQVEIDQANENIQINNRTLLANEEAQAEAQESQRQSLAIIEQNNLELADENLPDDRRAELEANNAAQQDAILQNAAVIDEAQNNIDSATSNIDRQQASIQQNQTVIADNASAFTANDGSLLVQDDGVPEFVADPADSFVEADNTLTILSEEETAALFDGVDPELVNSFVEAEAPVDVEIEQDPVEDVFVEAEAPADVGDEDPFEAARLEAEQELNREDLALTATEVEPESDPFEAARLEAEAAQDEQPQEFSPADVGDEDPFEAARLEQEQELNREDLALTATDVEPDQDPFEASRLEAEAALDESPQEFGPEDVGDEDPFEAARLEREQELNREELSVEANEPEPAEDPYEQSRLDAEAGLNDEPIEFEPADVDPAEDPFEESRLEAEQELNRQELSETATEAEPVGAEELGNDYGFESNETEGENPPPLGGPEPVPDVKYDEFGNVVPNTPETIAAAEQKTAEQQAAEQQAAAKLNAINQATRQSLYKAVGSSDWRVRLQLSESSDYLYNASPPGILGPLAATNGVIFPYTPQISTAYRANYEQYDLVHSNYRGVYYKNSRVDDLNIRCAFTAQDTQEADYLLAVIHFFRSVTKMFYGKDEQRGSPPPLVYLSGLGMNQFNGHPCVVTSFTYSLPDNVDYIRATSVNNYGTDLLSRRTPGKAAGVAGLGATSNRILNSGLERFFPAAKPAPDVVVGSVNNSQLANYVPTKMEIDITLIPVQTRSQVSKQFSLKGFANGDLIKGGYW